jgi:RNA polymerase sigma-70 factor (ECF subfamily)
MNLTKMLVPVSDEAVMSMVRQNMLDEAGLLFKRYHLQVYNFFLRMTFNREISQDLTQNVFLRLLKYRHTYDPELNFKTWLFRITRNEYKDHLRRQTRIRSNFADLETINEELRNYTDSDQKTEDLRMLHTALTRISNEYRSLIIMSRYHKLKYSEIAVITHSRESAVKVKVFRAMQKLREEYFKLVNQ